MADVERIVDIVLRGRDEVSQTIKGVKRAFDGAEDLAGPFADVADAVLAANAAIAAVGGTIFILRDEFRTANAQMAGSLQATTEELEVLGGVAQYVFSNAFAGSIGEASRAVTEAQKRLKDFELSAGDLQFAVESAFSFQDLWGADIEETLSASRTLMKNFGLDIQESMDFVAAGFRDGLDASGDFVESITEYSTQFSSGGASAEQFFSIMQSGLQDGILGTDKAADAFKEFRVRIQDGSKTTADALESLG